MSEWEIEKYREQHESEEHWRLRKAFLLRWKNYYHEDRLVCLARLFINITLLGCRYSPEVMNEIAGLSEERIPAYSEQIESFTRAQGFVTAAEDRRGSESDDCIIVPEEPPTEKKEMLFGTQTRKRKFEKLPEGNTNEVALTTEKQNPLQNQSTLDLTSMAQAKSMMTRAPSMPWTSTWQFKICGKAKKKKNRPSSQPVTKTTKAKQRSQPISKAQEAVQQSSTTIPALNCANANPPAAPVARDNADAARKAGGGLRVETVESQPSPSDVIHVGMSTAVGSDAVAGPAPHSEPTTGGKSLKKKRRGGRGKRFGKTPSTTANTLADPNTKQPQTTAKREQNADDTASAQKTTIRPTSGAKHAQNTVDTASAQQSSTAAAMNKDHLLVAIKVLPLQGMTTEQSEKLTESLNEAMDRLADMHNEGQAVFFPAFKGKPFLSDGVLKVWCEDDGTLTWLHSIINQLSSPIPNTWLAVVKQSEIARLIKAGLMLPGCKISSTADIVRFHSLLCGQNTWCNVDAWELWSHDQQEKGLFLILGVPVTDIPTIMARQRRMCFRLGSTYLRFFGPHGLQDTPPTFEPPTKPSIPVG